MKNKKELEDLYDYCRWNDVEGVKDILEQSSDIDVLDDQGLFFRLAISSANIEMLNILLKYYEKVQLQEDFEDKYKVPLAKQKLYTVLQDAVNKFDVSEEMQAILNHYIPKQEDSELGDFQEFNNHDLDENNLIVSFIKKSHSMDDIRNHSNGKNSYSTHEHSDEELLATKNAAEDLEFTKFKNDLLSHKITNLDEHEKGVAGHLEDSTDHHSD